MGDRNIGKRYETDPLLERAEMESALSNCRTPGNPNFGHLASETTPIDGRCSCSAVPIYGSKAIGACRAQRIVGSSYACRAFKAEPVGVA